MVVYKLMGGLSI